MLTKKRTAKKKAAKKPARRATPKAPEPKVEILAEDKFLRVSAVRKGKDKSYVIEARSQDAHGQPKWDAVPTPPPQDGHPSAYAVVVTFLCAQLESAKAAK